MLFEQLKKEYRLVKAFKKLFYEANGDLKPEAREVLAFWRDEAGARGELGHNGVPYFYDNKNRFDANAAAFLLGKRRMFDLTVKYLALDEREVFRLTNKREAESVEQAEAELVRELEV